MYTLSYIDKNDKLVISVVDTIGMTRPSVLLAIKEFCVQRNLKLTHRYMWNQSWWEITFPDGYVTTLNWSKLD